MRTENTISFEGFTLVEVMVAILVLGLAVVGIVSMRTAAVGSTANARIKSEGTTLAAKHIETLMALDNGHDWLADTNGDGGTDRDGNNNFIDDDDEDPLPGLNEDGVKNYGLDANSAATADNSIVTDDNEYDIFWNVAPGRPAPNIDTIRVIVVPRRGLTNRVVKVDFLRPRLF